MPVPDFAVGEVLTSAAMDSIGLWLIETKDVVTAGIVDFDDVFSTDYRGYKLMWDYQQNTSTGDLRMQYKNSSGAIANNYFFGWGGSYVSSGTPTWASFSLASTSQASAFVCPAATATNRCAGWHELINPTDQNIAYGQGQGSSRSASATVTFANLMGGTHHNTSDVRTGVRLFPSAGTMTGKFTLYGYRN
jgi:hypothetical protein